MNSRNYTKQVKEDKLNLSVVWHTKHVCRDTFEKQQASLQRIDKPCRRMASVVVLVSVYLDTQILDCKERSQWHMVFHKESHVSSKNVAANDSIGWALLLCLATDVTIQIVTQPILSLPLKQKIPLYRKVVTSTKDELPLNGPAILTYCIVKIHKFINEICTLPSHQLLAEILKLSLRNAFREDIP